jgi:hypothetical protein
MNVKVVGRDDALRHGLVQVYSGRLDLAVPLSAGDESHSIANDERQQRGPDATLFFEPHGDFD